MNPSRCRTPTLAGDRMKASDGSLIFVAVVIYVATPADVEEPFLSRAASTQTACHDQRDARERYRRVFVPNVAGAAAVSRVQADRGTGRAGAGSRRRGRRSGGTWPRWRQGGSPGGRMYAQIWLLKTWQEKSSKNLRGCSPRIRLGLRPRRSPGCWSLSTPVRTPSL